jgi:uncharacterized protein YydD (DUF2326 family)
MNQGTITTAEKIERLVLTERTLARLALDTAAVRSQITHVEQSLQDDPQQDRRELVALYAEMGRVLPDVVEATFQQVEAFHRSVTANRWVHLSSGLARLRVSLADLLAKIEEIEAERDAVPAR